MRNTGGGRRRQAYQLAIIVISLLVIQGLSRGLIDLAGQEKRLHQAEAELGALSEKEKELQKELETYQSDAYVEKIARDKLLMAKEGETVYVLPGGNERDSTTAAAANNLDAAIIPVMPGETNRQSDVLTPNWKQWLRIVGISW